VFGTCRALDEGEIASRIYFEVALKDQIMARISVGVAKPVANRFLRSSCIYQDDLRARWMARNARR
jgi:hypothetical protein